MLRTKQVGQISQCARYFFVSGSRNNTQDGVSHDGSEDKAYAPRKQQKNRSPFPQKTSDNSARPGILPYGDGVGAIGYYKSEGSVRQASVAHTLSASRSSLILDGEKNLDGDARAKEKDVHSSVPEGHSSVKAHAVGAGSLSNLVNYKHSTSNQNGKFNTMINPARPFSNVDPSNVKPLTDNPSAQQRVGSNFKDRKGMVQKSVLVTSTNHVSSNSLESADYGEHSEKVQKKMIPQGSKQNSCYSHPKSGKQNSEKKVNGSFYASVDNVEKHQRVRTKTVGNGRHLVEHAHHILEQGKWGPAVEAALDNLSCLLSVYHGNQILKKLQDPSVARGFFYWLKRQPGFKHDEHSYTTLVGILGRARQFNVINKLLDEMIEEGCLPNVVTYNRLIHSYGRANYLNEAIDIFYQMQEAGCEPDRVTYCTLMDIHAKAGFLDVALDIYRRMQEAGLAPDTFTYSVMINCLGKAGHLDSSYQLFCDMLAHGCTPNLVTYNIMIALQAKARNYPRALQLYRDMETCGFQPDKVTYSIVMEVLGHCGHLDEAEAIFTEMKRKNWVPDEPVYGLLVDLRGKAGDVDKALGWYQAMIDAGVRPNVPTCNSLLSAFLRVHRFSDAYDVLQSMPRLGLNPSLQTYTLLLGFCTDTHYFSEMGQYRELMAVTGHPAHAFLQSMPAAGPDGQNVREHASSFLDLMHSEALESKRGLVDAVVDFLHKSGLKEEASSVWEVAAQKNVYPDAVREKSSCYWLINLHVMSDGTALTALSRTLAWFRRELLVSGVGPMRIDIVTGWGRRSKVTGSSLVRQSVKELLNIFDFPFSSENGNSGCFVGRGDALCRWLLHPYVERMHLL